MIPVLDFHGIFVASQSLHLKNIWRQEEPWIVNCTKYIYS